MNRNIMLAALAFAIGAALLTVAVSISSGEEPVPNTSDAAHVVVSVEQIDPTAVATAEVVTLSDTDDETTDGVIELPEIENPGTPPQDEDPEPLLHQLEICKSELASCKQAPEAGTAEQEAPPKTTLQDVHSCMQDTCGDPRENVSWVKTADILARNIRSWSHCIGPFTDHVLRISKGEPGYDVETRAIPSVREVREKLTCMQEQVVALGLRFLKQKDGSIVYIDEIERTLNRPQLAFALLVWDHVEFIHLGRQKLSIIRKQMKELLHRELRYCIKKPDAASCASLCDVVQDLSSPDGMLYHLWGIQPNGYWDPLRDFLVPSPNGLGLRSEISSSPSMPGHFTCVISKDTYQHLGFAR